MDQFETALSRTLVVEGGFVDDPKDSGGATRWGVTERVARQYGYQGPMSEYPKESAKAVYRQGYWDPLKLAAIASLAPKVAYEMFDTAVNTSPPGGPFLVAKWFQRALNSMNDTSGRYMDITVDGEIGPGSLAAFRAFMDWRKEMGERVLTALLNGLQATYYLELSERRPKDERFMFGWISQRVVNGE